MKDPRDKSRRDIDAELLKKKRQDKKRALSIRKKRNQKEYDRQT